MSGINENAIDIEVMKALSDETRVDILYIIGNSEINVNEIAKNCKVSRPTISHHLQIMKRAGILTSRKSGKEMYYSINKYKLTSLAETILSFISW